MSSSLAQLPYINFLSAYPHPAFIVRGKRRTGRGVLDINPALGNPSFRSLLLGPDADTAELGRAFLRALQTVDAAERFAHWLYAGHTDPALRSENIEIRLRPPWVTIDVEPIVLELTQTVLEDFIVCTSTPRSPLPKFTSTSVADSPVSAMSSQTRGSKRMRLPDFPPAPNQLHPNISSLPPDMFSTLSRSPTGPGRSSHSPERCLEASASAEEGRKGGMREMIENYDWHSTPLGPRNEWSNVLKAAVEHMLVHPFPLSLWWTDELVLLYNDAYKGMLAHKHPAVFAEHGSVSWAELWDIIGPKVRNVFAGEAVCEQDDLLFIERMTEAKLPEETYHSWSWVPIQEDGVVKGFLNGTFETTTKVITERRMNFLKDFVTRAGLGRTTPEFAKTLLLALDSFTIDCPFAALYFASITESGSASSFQNNPRTSYIRKPVDNSPMRIKLTCAGSVGVPMPHPSIPETMDLVIDPSTIRPSPQARAETASPVPSLRSQDSTATATPHEETRSSTSSSSSVRARTVGLGSSVSGNTSRGGSIKSSRSSPTSSRRIPGSAVLWPFAEAFATRRAVHVPVLPDYAVEGFETRGWGEPAREAIVIPICVEESAVPAATLIMGLNSRRPYSDAYAKWMDLFRLAMNAMLTAVKGREADLKRAQHLAELDSAKTAFFSNVSHELRTPLTLIQGPLQDAISSLPDSRARDSLKMADRNVMRLSRLVDSLMDFSKLAANKLEGQFRPVHLGECTADLASLFRSVIEKSRIEYIVDCDTNDRKQTYIDPDFWEKIVFNLIGNAFKYTLRGSIHIRLEYDSDHAYFHVKDTGVGIPEFDISKVFDRFHRVDAISRSHEGTGIGLALTKELVKLHGGTLSVTSATEKESPDNHGSCFTVTLPLGRDHLPAAHVLQTYTDAPQHRVYARGIVDEATQWAARQSDECTPSETSDSERSSDNGGKMDPSTLFFERSDVILLVDDNADMRRYIKSLFIPFCQVIEANNGQEALNLLDEIKPNLILSDVMMPILDGYALIQHVHKRPEMKLTPIILVTAKESEESRVQGLLSGADDYVSKPFTGKELIARVHLQMQLGKRRIELEGKFMERTREIQLLSDLSPVGICRADANRRIFYVNQRWYEISGHNPSVSGEHRFVEHWFDCIQEQDQQVAKDLWEAAFASQKSTAMETRFKNGIFAKWSLQPLHSPEGALTGLISTITDVSDQRYFEETRLQHAQEREALARKRAEEAEERRMEADERRRGQELLIDVTSHELRQPVSAILNCSSLVRSNLARHRDELERAYKNNTPFKPTKDLLEAIDDDLEALDAIYQCGLAQERIANDVLSLSRIQLQILSIHPVEFDLVTEVQRIVSIFRNELKMKRINLDLTFGESFERLGVTRVRSDKSRFGQVLTNLLSNGIKFTDTSNEKRDISVTVEVSRCAPAESHPCVPPSRHSDLDEEDDQPIDPTKPSKIFVFVAVRDSGPGLKPDDLALLFKRFQQGSNSHNVFGGSGLGLFVSRKLCDLMGGRIDVDSTFGKGATFRFFVEATTAPASSSSYETDHHDDHDFGDGMTTISSLGEIRATIPLHILITEDNLINQTVLNRQLLKAGCTTSLANNGLQAIRKIRQLAESDVPRKTFDAVLMDCEMPVMDGLTAVREIRKLEQTGELPVRSRVYALTGNARSGQVVSAREAGMDEVIIKPYRLDELLSKIQSSVLEETSKSRKDTAEILSDDSDMHA